MARRAGKKHASTETPANSALTAMNVAGSHESKRPFEEMRGQSPHLNNEGTVPSFLRAFRYHDRCMVGDKILDTQEVGRLNPGLQVDWRQHRIKLAR